MNWIAAILGVIVFVLIIISASIEGQKWEARFPPISDDEFMARLPPGTNREIALKVRRIIADQTAIEYERIHPDSSFVRDLDCC
jgi:hypothetical protein